MNEAKWLLLIHHLPPKPNYFRVKIWRQLQRLGAVAVKNAVYVLPKNETTQESFHWISKEMIQGGGYASICEANFVEGLAKNQIETLFTDARNNDYEELTKEARLLSKKLTNRAKVKEDLRKNAESELVRLKRRLSEVVNIDFFGASSRESAEGLITQIENTLRSADPGAAKIGHAAVLAKNLKSRTWVTRRGIHVDRIASAWLIKRFIDPQGIFKYVDAKTYVPAKGELRFDMFEAEFTHEGDLCTFEVLIKRTHLDKNPELREISQIIHNIDLKDSKYAREDTKGIEIVINGICMNHSSDEERLARGTALFDDLHEYFRKKPNTKGEK